MTTSCLNFASLRLHIEAMCLHVVVMCPYMTVLCIHIDTDVPQHSGGLVCKRHACCPAWHRCYPNGQGCCLYAPCVACARRAICRHMAAMFSESHGLCDRCLGLFQFIAGLFCEQSVLRAHPPASCLTARHGLGDIELEISSHTAIMRTVTRQKREAQPMHTRIRPACRRVGGWFI